MIDLNDEKTAYINARGKVVLNACPGSGKTTTIAYKLHTLIENNYHQLNIGGIACLSFTNVAKEEIKQKYNEFSKKSLNFPHTVSTIDSFINAYITLPFYYLLKEGQYQRPTILDENHHLNNFWINELWVYDTKRKKKLPKHKNIEGKYLLNIYPPSDIQKDINGIYTFKGNIPSSDKVDISIFNDYAETIKKWQFKNNILTNYDSTIFALNILSKFQQVTLSLAKRYGHIIVDEAQDTSEIQHAIFEKLIDNGLKNIELIGDPYQSLYSWRNAKPKVFLDKYNDQNWVGLNLSDNWRSTETIINTYSLLRNPTDKLISAKNKSEIDHPIYILNFEKDNEIQALEKYNQLITCYKNNRAVTRGVELSEKLNGISDIIDYWKNPIALKIVNSILDLKTNNIKSAIDNFRSVIVDIVFINPKLSYSQKREKIKELKSNYEINGQIYVLLNEFSDFDLSLLEWTSNTTKRLTEHFELTSVLDFELKKGSFSPNHKRKMKDLFIDKSTSWNFPISTIHKVKGMTFDTTLLFLHKNKHSISLSDVFPSNEGLTDNQTMIYVAMSRPKHILAIAIEDSVDKKEIINKFGNKIVFL